jgi:Protein of unknown function (DUF2490)
MKKLFYFLLLLFVSSIASAQSTRQVAESEQIWLGYFNQSRLSDKWGLWTDIHYRTKDNFVEGSYRFLARFAAIHYFTDDFRLLNGYTFNNSFPEEGHLNISQPEHRIWQQLQYITHYNKTRATQWLRLEERWLRKIKNDNELEDGYNYATRLRYNYLLQFPLSKKGIVPKTFSAVVNDEIFVNLGSKVLYNTFDQNRLFVGLAYTISTKSTLQFGYMNVYQQLAAGNKYKNLNTIRVFFFQNFDFRKKKEVKHSCYALRLYNRDDSLNLQKKLDKSI